MSASEPPALHVPARDIPVPSSISKPAQRLLSRGMLRPPVQWPSGDDPAAWRALVAKLDASIPDAMVAPIVSAHYGAVDTGVGVESGVTTVGGIDVHIATPTGTAPNDRRVYLTIHGGYWLQGGGRLCAPGAAMTAGIVGTRVWAVDYRLLPDHPFPAALDDCLAVYRALLQDHEPGQVAVGGVSAGANLALALTLRARDEGLPMPAAVVAISPGTDLTQAGDTMVTNRGIDNMLTEDVSPVFRLYAGDHDLRDPYLSPLFADFGRGFPPTILTSGTRDVMLSDTARVHRRLRAAGVRAELHVFEAAPHAMFLGTAPEEYERAQEVRQFLDTCWGWAGS